MKLIRKSLLWFLLASLPILFISGWLSYRIIRSELQDGIDETLHKEKQNLNKLIPLLLNKNIIYLSQDSLSFISAAFGNNIQEIFADTTIFDMSEQESVHFRYLKGNTQFHGKYYFFQIAKPTLEEDELLEGLLTSLLVLISLLIVVFFIVSTLLSWIIWKPFYTTLHKIETANLDSKIDMHFDNVNLYEFKKLNYTLEKLFRRLETDYRLQKEFTENASHEIQTPLAIIRNHIEMLIQSPNINSEEMAHIEAMDEAAQRLVRLNKSLLLLAKIENHQFENTIVFSLNVLTEKLVEIYKPGSTGQEMSLQLSAPQVLILQMNATLCEILIGNLFQNAIRHNFNKGEIYISIEKGIFTISNTGISDPLPTQELFRRFSKGTDSRSSTGLGLAIVKSICDLYNLPVHYKFKEGQHHFSIDFNSLSAIPPDKLP